MRHKSVRLFTFDNHPEQENWNKYQIWVGGLVHGKGYFVTKPEDEVQDLMMRRLFRYVEGYAPEHVEDIMNYIYKKL